MSLSVCACVASLFFYLCLDSVCFCLMRRKRTRARGDEMAVSLRTACINESVLLNALQGIGSEREYLIPCALIKITWAQDESRCLKQRKTVWDSCIRLCCLQGNGHLNAFVLTRKHYRRYFRDLMAMIHLWCVENNKKYLDSEAKTTL